MAQALLFNIGGEKKKKLRVQLVKLGIAPRDVLKADHGTPLGSLLHPADDPGAGAGEAEPFDDEMLVLDGLSPQQLRSLIDGMRQARASVDLKAVVTEENVRWTPSRLHRELRAEHEAMTGGGKSVHGAGRR